MPPGGGCPGPPGGLGAQFNESIPEPDGLLAANVDLIAEGFAGVAGAGHMDTAPLEVQGAQGVALRRSNSLAAGEDL